MSFISIYKNNDSIYMIKFGNYNISLTACITLLLGFILAVFTVIYMPNSYYMALLIVISFIIAAYEINCVELGKCDVWAWTLTTIYFVYVSGLLYLIYKNKHNPIGFSSDMDTISKFINSKMQRFVK